MSDQNHIPADLPLKVTTTIEIGADQGLGECALCGEAAGDRRGVCVEHPTLDPNATCS